MAHVLEHCDEDLAFFEKNISKDNLRERLRSVAARRAHHVQAVEHVVAAAESGAKKFEFPVEWAPTCRASTAVPHGGGVRE